MGRACGHGLVLKDSDVVWRVSRNVLNYTSRSYRTAGNARVAAPGLECYPSHVSLRWLGETATATARPRAHSLPSFFAYSWYLRPTSKALPVTIQERIVVDECCLARKKRATGGVVEV